MLLIKLRSVIRIRMCPVFAEFGAQLLLVCGQNLPVMQRVRLLGRADERRRFSLADIRTDFDHLGQATAKVIAAVASVELGGQRDHISITLTRPWTGVASWLSVI